MEFQKTKLMSIKYVLLELAVKRELHLIKSIKRRFETSYRKQKMYRNVCCDVKYTENEQFKN